MTGTAPVLAATAPRGGWDGLALRRGLMVIPVGDALLIEGSTRRRLLRGSPLGRMLSCVPSLLPLLASGCGSARICSETGLDPAVVTDLLGLLYDAGLLERAAGPAPEACEAARPASGFLSRTASTADDLARSGWELEDQLAHSAVLVLGPADTGAQIAADLVDTGVGSVFAVEDTRQVPPDRWSALRAAPHRAVAVFDGAPYDRAAEDLIDAARRLAGPGLPILRYGSGTTALEVGPTFHGPHPACTACFRLGYAGLAVAPGASRGRPTVSGHAKIPVDGHDGSRLTDS
jgi:hypothetical protein